MRIRSLSPSDLEPLLEALTQGALFRQEEVSCARELLEAALARAEGRASPENTYEALVAAGDDDRAVGYACFGRTPMTDATYDLYWIVMPELNGRVYLGIVELAAFVGVGGIFLASFVRVLAHHPLRPISDPRVHESLVFQNV